MNRAHQKADGSPKWGTSSRAIADARAAGMQTRSKRPLSAYKCPVCPLWHLGRTPNGEGVKP
jgi:hypothetical protein